MSNAQGGSVRCRVSWRSWRSEGEAKIPEPQRCRHPCAQPATASPNRARRRRHKQLSGNARHSLGIEQKASHHFHASSYVLHVCRLSRLHSTGDSLRFTRKQHRQRSRPSTLPVSGLRDRAKVCQGRSAGRRAQSVASHQLPDIDHNRPRGCSIPMPLVTVVIVVTKFMASYSSDRTGAMKC